MDEDELMELCGVGADDMGEIREESHVMLEDCFLQVERALLLTDLATVQQIAERIKSDMQNQSDDYDIKRLEQLLTIAQLVSTGKFVDALCVESSQAFLKKLTEACHSGESDGHFCCRITSSCERLVGAEDSRHQIVAAYEAFLIGVAFFSMYVQSNYSGPAFEDNALDGVLDTCEQLVGVTRQKLHTESLLHLQVDGETPFSICEHPQFLLLGRCLLHFVGDASFKNWSFSRHLKGEDNNLRNDDNLSAPSSVGTVLTKLHSASWWCARSSIAHERLVLSSSPSTTLWLETKRNFAKTLARSSDLLFGSNKYLRARAHVEWGLAQHFFEKNNKGKLSFEEAKDVSGLHVKLSGLMGKRTKFQQKNIAQMILFAASKDPPKSKPSESANAMANNTHESFGGKRKVSEEESEQNQTENEAELQAIQKLVDDKEAAYRTIQLDQADPDNILLEQIAFEDNQLTAQGNLQTIDQVILLALCLDVKNSNPNDGLTREEMMPYITRVLENPNNWMVYSTGLLERAWLECETSKRRERAVLQMQALVDQHTTRLTITQTSLKMIEDSAPASERLEFIHSLAFPPRYALKKDLAERYLSLGVVRSALEIFEELEMWDDVVKCYQILDQPTKAEALVRKRLDVAPTPYMWCCLGDVTGDETHYETAWELSKHRFSRAKRTLGRKAFGREEFEKAASHLKDSVEVSPMNTGAWFLLGVVGMRLKDWKLALESFTRVVQLEPDNGEAWGNIGSIHMKNDNYSQAFSVLQEALKQKRHMWQMWENFAVCAMETEKYGDAMYAIHQLLDMRGKHKRPIDHELLAWLVEALVFPDNYNKARDAGADKTIEDEVVASEALTTADEGDDLSELDEIATSTDKTPPLSHVNYKKQLAMLLGRVTSIVTNNPKVWQVYAHFNDGVERPQKALECRLRQCRALQRAGWETEEKQVVELCRAATRLAQDYMEANTRKALYSCRLYLRGILKKATMDFAENDAVKQLAETLQRVEAMEAQLAN